MKIIKRLQVTPIISERQDWGVTCANICRTPGRDLLCCWYGGPSEPESGTVDPHGLAYMSRLVDGVKAWSEPIPLVDTPEGIAVIDPIIFEYPLGTLNAVRSLQTECKWGEFGGAYLYLSRSEDDGHTWSDAALLCEMPPARNKNKPFVDGATCVFPVALELPMEAPIAAHLVKVGAVAFRDIAVLVSTDEGVSWRQTDLIQSSDGTRLMEPAMVKLSDGSLLMYLRSAPPSEGLFEWPEGKPGRIWQSTSSDSGFTWTEPTRTELPNNNSGFDLCRLPDGRLFLASNNHSRLGSDTKSLLNNRYPLVLVESTDDANTWSEVMTIDPGPGFEVSYASIIACPKGFLHCVYTYDRKAIKYIRIDPED